VKIVIDDNEFDGQDIDPRYEYIDYIEPTLVRTRLCYFELPIAELKKGTFRLKFSEMFVKDASIGVLVWSNKNPAARKPTARAGD
jgi:hypothetical protein